MLGEWLGRKWVNLHDPDDETRQAARAAERLKRRRRNVRWGTGYTALAIAVLWVLIAAFLVDWSLQTNRPQRVVLLVICAGVLIWAFRRFTRPWLGAHESELDVALLVEQYEHIDTD